MFLVGIAGGSGSGKTTFAHKVMKRVTDPSVVLLHQDSYYLPSLPSHLRVHGEPNYDHPDAFDWALLKDHLSRLKAGEQVATPGCHADLRVSRESTPAGNAARRAVPDHSHGRYFHALGFRNPQPL